MALSEFSLIERYFAPLCHNGRGVKLGIGDDCAVLEIPAGHQLAVSIDTLVEGTHFLPGTPAAAIAQRTIGACLSDLAAMGAEPAWITLALCLPEANEAWLKAFSNALGDVIKRWDISLVGGDTTRGEQLTISIQVHGWVPQGQALKRSGANTGDHIFVTGTLGDSAAGLDQLQQGHSDNWLIQRFYQPSPRLSTGIEIRPYASAAIDISDGLLADLGHILQQSGVGAIVDLQALPLSPQLQSLYDAEQAQQWALSGGEDFELCFCIPESALPEFQQQIQQHPVPCSAIGVITAAPGIQLQAADGSLSNTQPQGFRHF
ncbi:MAG: thiamine-phosphate kinase [Motiliproteus sp.]